MNSPEVAIQKIEDFLFLLVLFVGDYVLLVFWCFVTLVLTYV